MDDLASELEALWRDGIPLARAMQIRVEQHDEDHVVVAAALAPNINVHGTAFAGSLYSIAALTGWGAVWIALRSAGLTGDIVLARGTIEYLKPVRDRIVCESAWREGPPRDLAARLEGGQRAALALDCTIGTRGAAARFEGLYSLRCR